VACQVIASNFLLILCYEALFAVILADDSGFLYLFIIFDAKKVRICLLFSLKKATFAE
jgi:hypothetical protein